MNDRRMPKYKVMDLDCQSQPLHIVESMDGTFPQKKHHSSERLTQSTEIKEEDNTMMFVTKRPCDDSCARIKQIYTIDLDSNSQT
ncbi:cytidine and dCMP deaminase domain-containing protein 1 [Carassius gibelio]|uniref:cytidine and dCMP deaminase domain-containing protein 1 n=1 Tax=Carassius gibelio TaxID=101364 RepID=UPI00227917FC|nr:cytidine and dCMP deaminase domain-containing protein 1 [Carassius gibelio]